MCGKESEAERRIQLGIERLLGEYSFYVAILQKFMLRADRAMSTLGVCAIDDRRIGLIFNPEFITEISMEELQNSLLHEVLHVVFRHIYADPRDFPNHHARVIAEEVTVNEFIAGPLPVDVPRLQHYGLPPLESTAKRYERLVVMSQEQEQGQEQSNDAEQLEIGQDSESGSKQDRIKSKAQVDDVQESRSPSNSFTENHEGQLIAVTLDDHDLWQNGLDRETAAVLVEELLAEVSCESGGCNEFIDEQLQLSLEQHGIDPKNLSIRVNSNRAAAIDWRRLLRRYVGTALEPKPTFTRPNRRFPDLVGVIPGSSLRSSKPKILAAIDTSWSITASRELVSAIDGELRCFAKKYEVTVAECDARIQRVYKYRPLDVIKGGGGTNLKPIFERQFLRTQSPDVIIYFTDGEGPAPARKPNCAVIWCIVPFGVRPVAWGREVRIPADNWYQEPIQNSSGLY